MNWAPGKQVGLESTQDKETVGLENPGRQGTD